MRTSIFRKTFFFLNLIIFCFIDTNHFLFRRYLHSLLLFLFVNEKYTNERPNNSKVLLSYIKKLVYKFSHLHNWTFKLSILIAITQKYLQSDWLRGVQYWPYLYSLINICTLWVNKKKQKNTTFDFRNGKIKMYSLKTN